MNVWVSVGVRFIVTVLQSFRNKTGCAMSSYCTHIQIVGLHISHLLGGHVVCTFVLEDLLKSQLRHHCCWILFRPQDGSCKLVGRYLHCYSRRSIVYIYHKIWIIEIKFIIIIFKMLMYNTNVKLSYYYEVSIKNELFYSVHFKVVELPSYISKK